MTIQLDKGQLTHATAQHYWDDGYLFPIPCIGTDHAAKWRAELEPGQISLHLGLMIHGSGPNVTDDRRIGAVIRYLSPHVEKPGGHRDYGFAARGNCDTGNYNLTHAPSGWFTPDDLKVYEKVRADQAKVMMAGATGNAEMYS